MKYEASQWLESVISESIESENADLHIPKKFDGSDYEISDLYPDQQYIAYSILAKVKQFMTMDDLSKFVPLRCTVNGQAGTGKSVLINTITSVLRRMFNYNNVVKVVAPTGVAAFNVGGETIHNFASFGNFGGDSLCMSTNDRQKLVARLKHLLCLIIDERSMVSSKTLGNLEQRLKETIFQGQGFEDVQFGGLPILVLAGDDYQLPSVEQGCIQCRERIDGGKAEERGRSVFRTCAETVFKLPVVHRIADEKADDRDLLDRLRIGECVTDDDVKRLQNLHIDNIERKHGKKAADDIKKESVYLFWTNEKRVRHNLSCLAALNSPNNPTAVVKARSSSAKNGKAVSSHFSKDAPSTSMFCVGSKVAITGRNFKPSWGLHNGACGEVQEIVFESGNSPNKGNLPSYVVVDFPLYQGPAWDLENPTVRMTVFLCFYTYHYTNNFVISTYQFRWYQYHAQRLNVVAVEHLYLWILPLLEQFINSKDYLLVKWTRGKFQTCTNQSFAILMSSKQKEETLGYSILLYQGAQPWVILMAWGLLFTSLVVI